MELLNRHMLPLVASYLEKDGVVAVIGARQTGKTTLCEKQAPDRLGLAHSYISFDDPDERYRFQRSAVSILESMTTPLVVLDEIQKIPAIFDPLKLVIDRQTRKRPEERIRFLLTGSSHFLRMRNIRESLAGRISLCRLHPFSLAEVAGAAGTPSLLDRIWPGQAMPADAGDRLAILPPARVRTIGRLQDRHQTWGGFPPVWERVDEAERLRWLRNYRATYLERDIADEGQVASLDTFALAQKLLCARTSEILSVSEVARDAGVAVNTVKRYLELLTATFQCVLLPPWHESTSKRLVKSPKIFFPDPGLDRALLGELGISRGAAYESWVLGELLKWREIQPVPPDLFFYRTSAGLEIDFLLTGESGIIPVEAKATERVSAADGRSVAIFLKEHPARARVGLVVHPGTELAEIRPNVWAVPDWYLFAGG